jgi:hypothetical protein
VGAEEGKVEEGEGVRCGRGAFDSPERKEERNWKFWTGLVAAPFHRLSYLFLVD